MRIPLMAMVWKRAPWLVILLLGEMLTATAMAFYEQEIAKAVVLAVFLPMIISSGGNSGSQASTLIIRAMALGEVTLRDWWHVMRREIGAGALLGVLLGVLGAARVAIWATISEKYRGEQIYGEHWPLVAATIGVTLTCVVLWGSLSGSMLPFLLRRFGLDPATSSAPFVATLVDVTGVIIYFTLALFIMRGTLL
jgi:magnesium transporter